jgi:hypothetical protein
MLDQNLDQNVDQKCRPKITTKNSCTFFKAKRGLHTESSREYYSISSIYVSKNNGRKQKRDADFTETATEKKTFMLRSLVFDFGSARVEKSIA